jgi:3D (Asp-Asp-Asp) domain-containing protein
MASSHSAHSALTAIASSPGGRGYWLLAANGSVHAFGTALNLGSARTAPGVTANALAATRKGAGYVLATTGRLPAEEPSLRPARAMGGKAPASLVLRPPTLKLLGNFLVTCYDLTGVTASGEMAGPQSVAVDPSVIPLGEQIYVQGIGLRTADDTGGAIVGDHVDIWEPTYGACADWGAQVRSVYLVAP